MKWCVSFLTAALLAGLPASASAERQLKGDPTLQQAVRSAERWAEGRAGRVSVSVKVAGGHQFGFGAKKTYSSASVSKAMLLVAYLRERRHERLSGSEKSLLEAMITRSDNAAASEINSRLSEGDLKDLARAAGMRDWRWGGVYWGGTQISARDQAAFFWKIEKLLPSRHKRFAMRALRSVVASQSWGLPEAKPRGWKIFFKGGWYPDAAGWRVHQVALLRERGEPRQISVAVLTSGQPSYSYGQRTIEGVGERLRKLAR